jgi:phenylpyruvate tautomerase PptA (4-oxalocrotonate tautomerase family)
MPCLQLHTSVAVPEPQRAALLARLSKLVAESIGKPEAYVMITLREGPMSMAGEIGPAAFADVRSIGGLSPAVNKRIMQRLCSLLEKELGVPPARTFANFTDVPASAWGHDGGTFG